MRTAIRLVVCLILVCYGVVAAQEVPSPVVPDLSGVWQSDLSAADAQRHIRAYLAQGRELQLKWCGFAWPESEIDRRVAIIVKSSLKWEISATEGNKAFLRRATNETGRVITDIFRSCGTQGDMIKCKVCPIDGSSCNPDDVYLRLDGQRLYLIAPVRKSQMQCPKRDASEDEAHYVSPTYLERKQ